jgi:hypothetical protein
MLLQEKTRDLARSLVASATGASATSLKPKQATVRVYEKLRRQLGAPFGVGGFRALGSRALALARSESPGLSAVQITADGGLRGLGEGESQADVEEGGEAGIILIAQMLGLFLIFLGEATTLRLMEDLHHQMDTEAAASTTANMLPSAADGLATAAAFEDLLLEIDRLRDLSVRIEILATHHPGMEDGLVSAAGKIRNIATVLDIFTLIRSKAGGSQEDASDQPTHSYMN